MNFELVEQLEKLGDGVEDFMDYAEDYMSGGPEETFLQDESGISNTELDNFIETLKHVTEFINKLTRR
jgi:hypothetical protein